MKLDFFAAGVCCLVLFNLVSSRTPAFFSSELLPSQSPAVLLHGVIPFCVKDYIWFCCTSWGSCCHFSSLSRFFSVAALLSSILTSPPTWWSWTCAESALCTVNQDVNEGINRSLREAICYWLPAGFYAWHIQPGSLASFPHILLSIHLLCHQFGDKETV